MEDDDLKEIRQEAAAIGASLRELLLWEEGLGGGVPPDSGLLAAPVRPQRASRDETAGSKGAPAGAASAVRSAPSALGVSPAVAASAPASASAAVRSAPSASGVSPAVAASAPASSTSADPSAAAMGERSQGAPSTSSAAQAAPAAQATGVDRAGLLRIIASEAASCERCGLHTHRTRSVFARGSARSELVFVGEGPGASDDEAGVPFVGRAGELLDKMVAAMGFARDEVYVCNVVKCRTPDNRAPSVEEAGACSTYLTQQLAILQPMVIVALGRCAAENLGVAEPGQSAWRGQWGSFEGVPVMPTYDPAYLLRSPDEKKPVWEDLKKVVSRLGRTLPHRR